MDFIPYSARKTKSLIILKKNAKTVESAKKRFFKGNTLFDELSPENSSFHLDFLRMDDIKSSQNVHTHQESFGLMKKNTEESISMNYLKEESPKFANGKENSSFLISNSTIEADFSSKNPFPNENFSITSNSNEKNEKNMVYASFDKNNENSEEIRRKLLEIDKRRVFLRDKEEKYQRIDKWQKLMKISLNMIPSGMFFTKIIDFSENLLYK